jgi:hypothetical protein
MKKPLKIETKLVRDRDGNPKRFTKKSAFNELRTHGDKRRVEIEDLGDHWRGIVTDTS